MSAEAEDPILKPRRTHRSTGVFRLPGGTEDNDLWYERGPAGEVRSTWVPTDEQRDAIAAGANIELAVFARITPAVSMALTDVPLGKPPG